MNVMSTYGICMPIADPAKYIFLSCSSVKSGDCYPPMEPRFVMLKKVHPHDSLGVTLVGGNAVGIFIRSVQPNSVSGGPKGLRYGDQILEVCTCVQYIFTCVLKVLVTGSEYVLTNI